MRNFLKIKHFSHDITRQQRTATTDATLQRTHLNGSFFGDSSTPLRLFELMRFSELPPEAATVAVPLFSADGGFAAGYFGLPGGVYAHSSTCDGA